MAFGYAFFGDRTEFFELIAPADEYLFERTAHIRRHARFCQRFPPRLRFEIAVADFNPARLFVELIIAQQRRRILRPLERIFFDALRNDFAQKRVDQFVGKRRTRLTHLLEQNFHFVGAVKRPLARQHLVQNEPERVDVGRRRRSFAHRLLGRHVMRRPGRPALRREMRRLYRLPAYAQRLVRKVLDKPEVQNLHKILFAVLNAKHQIRRLQVAVNHPALMRFAQRFQDLLADVQTPVVAQRALGL